MSKTDRKLDLFALLNSLSRKRYGDYQSLSDEEKKEAHPLIIMRWLSGTNDARQVVFLNELVNPFVFSLHNHKDLIMMLSSVCGSGDSRRYSWMKAKAKQKASMPLSVDVIREYFGYNTSDAQDALQLLTSDDVLEYATELGKQPDEITKIKKELKKKDG